MWWFPPCGYHAAIGWRDTPPRNADALIILSRTPQYRPTNDASSILMGDHHPCTTALAHYRLTDIACPVKDAVFRVTPFASPEARRYAGTTFIMPWASKLDFGSYYLASGKGPALVFAHGAGGNYLSWWQRRISRSAMPYRSTSRSHTGPKSRFRAESVSRMPGAG